ncbi:MAG: RagB/SusD family nutrient uptake outer membrane protein [Bacteroidia bacterium]|nr:RagB/SusD family nutrient uptake outer membrane protein [Bacteroidia bacterium]
MKTTIRLSTVIFAFALCLASCNNFLDIQPKGILIPRTAAEYEGLLNYAQLQKASESYPVFLTDDAFLPDEAADDYTPGLDFADRATANLYTFQSEVFGDAEEDGLWTYSYNRLYYYNVIIQHILEATEATLQEKQSIRAEALMGRAFEYLTLVNAYAKHYDPQTAATDPGVPLILDEDINRENLTRATVQEVYDQIQEDLKEAEKYLPARPKLNAFRASKPVGLGMLARMYLYMGNYSEALNYANQSLKQNDYLLNLGDYEVVDPYQAIGRLNVPESSDNNENIYIRLAPWVFGISAEVFGSDDLLQLFDENDQRFKLYFSNEPFGIPNEHYLWMPYLYANMAMSTPEMYLIAAECEARIGSKDRAMTLINQLRDHRIEDNTPLSAASNDEALVQVLEERRRELTMIGCTRLIDLKRLNKEPRFAKTITRVAEGQTYTLPPNDPRYVLPIPAKVLRFNPDMEPNIR